MPNSKPIKKSRRDEKIIGKRIAKESNPEGMTLHSIMP